MSSGEEPHQGPAQQSSFLWTQHLLTETFLQDQIVTAKMEKEDERRDDRYMESQF